MRERERGGDEEEERRRRVDHTDCDMGEAMCNTIYAVGD